MGRGGIHTRSRPGLAKAGRQHAAGLALWLGTRMDLPSREAVMVHLKKVVSTLTTGLAGAADSGATARAATALVGLGGQQRGGGEL